MSISTITTDSARVMMPDSGNTIPLNDHDPDSTSHRCHKSSRLKRLCAISFVTFTLGIPYFHASVTGRGPALELPPAVIAWKAVRTFDSILLAALMAALFKASAGVNVAFWFFVCWSMVQAVMGLISSTILIMFFSGHYRVCIFSVLLHAQKPMYVNIKHGYLGDVAGSTFLCWNIWDLFAVPSIWTTWSVITLVIALIINVARPNIVQTNIGIIYNDQLGAAQIILLVLISVSLMFFVFFILYLRRVTHTLQTACALGGV
ncbi:hypothetical protein AX15_006408 [Amanita polypyramis BW_CC]|nr:hypothetical protein AX15_006408 [Amanita polypyramis BW_CC]